MPKDYKQITTDINQYTHQLRKLVPDATAGFSALAGAATQEGLMSKKQKELVAVAISVAVQCDACIGFHTKALVKLGATREELAEVLAMNLYLGGGPSLMYAADALRSFDQFLEG